MRGSGGKLAGVGVSPFRRSQSIDKRSIRRGLGGVLRGGMIVLGARRGEKGGGGGSLLLGDAFDVTGLGVFTSSVEDEILDANRLIVFFHGGRAVAVPWNVSSSTKTTVHGSTSCGIFKKPLQFKVRNCKVI